MNYSLSHIPVRTKKPREEGLTMVMDKGLSMRQAEDMIDASGDLIDIIKLGFGTSFITPRLTEKIALYKKANMRVYLGGTLFEAFIARGQFKDYVKVLDQLGLDTVEVSDGSINMPMKEKCKYISELAKHRTVLSEVGSKESGILISPAKWVSMMRTELDAGSWKVIAEARESGTVGIYRPSGHAHTQLVNRILAKVASKD
ncbi:MAG TPA: phosphosulfolactate synthase, partial [Flavobacteriales bacterium]|nr:phosphosulfolactate synthase [Flavobacteriales bacterium]